MPAASDPTFLVLHGLRLKGFAEAGPLAGLTGLDEATVQSTLDALVSGGIATKREGRLSGYALNADGRERHAREVKAELEAAGERDTIDSAYRRFLGVNGDLLAVCTDWQLKNGQMNAHDDAEYDAKVVARLRAVDDAVQPICADLAGALARFAPYGPRLGEAVSRVESGERDWFAKPMIDSYHTVWFELHEDLLVTLGIERSKEGS